VFALASTLPLSLTAKRRTSFHVHAPCGYAHWYPVNCETSTPAWPVLSCGHAQVPFAHGCWSGQFGCCGFSSAPETSSHEHAPLGYAHW
jgi:hypothetical protein